MNNESRNIMSSILGLAAFLFLFVPNMYANSDTFEVKGTSTKSFMFMDGKMEKSGAGDQVVYFVDIPSEVVTRTGVYNAGIKSGSFAGLQSDNTKYTIFHDDSMSLSTDERIIKAFGKAGLIDGYEMIVIGDTFINTVRSTDGYFVIYQYKRTDQHAREYRVKHAKASPSFIEKSARVLQQWIAGE